MPSAIKPAVSFGNIYFPTFTPVNYVFKQQNTNTENATVLWNTEVWNDVSLHQFQLRPTYYKISKEALKYKLLTLGKNAMAYNIHLSKPVNFWVKNFYFNSSNTPNENITSDVFLKIHNIPVFITNETNNAEPSNELNELREIFNERQGVEVLQNKLQSFFMRTFNPWFFLHKTALFSKDKPGYAQLMFDTVKRNTIPQIIKEHNHAAVDLQTTP